MHVPGPARPGVKVMKVKGIGTYYYPSKEECKNSSSAIMWIHGGGRIMGSASGHGPSDTCSRIVNLLGIPVFSPIYRFAPEFPFPAALDDIHAAYHWLAKDLEAKSADKKIMKVKIGVAGDSVGSGLAAELSQRLLDKSQEQTESAPSKPGVPLPVCQLLIYPMLDDRTCLNDSLSKMPHLVWNNKSNKYAWSSYLGLGHEPGDEHLPKYSSAARRKDLSGLPPAWILVGNLDLFHTECIEYARRLKADGVETELAEAKGSFHGFMTYGKEEQPIVKGWEKFRDFGKKFLVD